MSNNYTPPHFHSITPALICKNAAGAIEFYKTAFDAAEILRLEYPGGGIGHAELLIGDSPVMLADEHPDMGFFAPGEGENVPVSMHLYVPDADETCARAVAGGATLTRPVADQFYGDRVGHLTDPYGHRWSIATAGKPMPKEELLKVWDEMMKSS